MLNQDLISSLKDEIEHIVEQEDENYCDRDLCDYFDGNDRDEVLKRFSENYSSRQIGFIDRDQMDGAELLAAMVAQGLSTKQIYNLIMSHCTAVARNDVYIHWNDMDSVQIGEMEYQIDIREHPALSDLVAAATDDELKVAGITDRESFCAYGRPCELICLKLDALEFLKEVNALLGPETEGCAND